MPGRENSRTCGVIINDMLNRLGKDNTDTENRDLAQDVLNQSIDDFNNERVWSDRLLETSFTATSVGTTYTLPLRFQKTIGRIWALNSDNERVIEIADLPWEEFMRRIANENVSASGIQFISIQNRVDRTVFEVFPLPNTDWVSNYPRLEFQYYADITHCTNNTTSASSSTLDVNTGLERAIELNALYILNDYIGSEKRADRFQNQAARSLGFAIGADNRIRVNHSNLRGYR